MEFLEKKKRGKKKKKREKGYPKLQTQNSHIRWHGDHLIEGCILS